MAGNKMNPFETAIGEENYDSNSHRGFSPVMRDRRRRQNRFNGFEALREDTERVNR